MKVYFISGLGADRRAFYKIQLPAGFQPVYLDWIDPLPNESLGQYAGRLAGPIPNHEPFVLIGLSLGGMVASEIAKLKPPFRLIIISSLACNKEQPRFFKWVGKMGLHKIVSPFIYKKATWLNTVLGRGSKQTKAIVYNYVKNADPWFIRWSMNAIIKWKHSERLPGLVHIHGSNDHLLPCRYVHADYIIKNGGHLMIMNRTAEINRILAEVLIRKP